MASAYNLAFPTLIYPGLTSKKPKSNNCSSLIPLKFPDYLKQTLYGDLVAEQNELLKQKEVSKIEPALDTDNQLALLDLRLPTFWSTKDRSSSVEVGVNGLELRYVGPGRQEVHAGLARANFPMRPQCGVYYFEMQVLSKGEDGYVGIGFCGEKNNLERLPGWDEDSWGYHGDDGHSFAGSGTGQNYGPRFITGDVIGCGVSFTDGTAFYTKNGKPLGIAFRGIDTSKPLYPSVGLRTVGEKITVNFGHEPFMYDIVGHIREQKSSVIREITFKEVDKTNNSLDQLIVSYMIHHGYTKAASTFIKENKELGGTLKDRKQLAGCEANVEERISIRAAILNGDMNEAISLTRKHFPKVLEEKGGYLLLLLKCGSFIEMMRKYCDFVYQENSQSRDVCADHTQCVQNGVKTCACPDSVQSSPVEERPGDAKDLSNASDQNKDISVSFLESVMKYGQQIQEEYKSDLSRKAKASLMEIFSLLAYPNPYNSPVAYIMKTSRRDSLATEVNSAILAFLKQPETPALERICRQTILTYKMLAIKGDGKSALIKVDGNYSMNTE